MRPLLWCSEFKHTALGAGNFNDKTSVLLLAQKSVDSAMILINILTGSAADTTKTIVLRRLVSLRGRGGG